MHNKIFVVSGIIRDMQINLNTLDSFPKEVEPYCKMI